MTDSFALLFLLGIEVLELFGHLLEPFVNEVIECALGISTVFLPLPSGVFGAFEFEQLGVAFPA